MSLASTNNASTHHLQSEECEPSKDLMNSAFIPPCPLQLQGKKGLILGVANQRSIAWSCAEQLSLYGAELTLTVLDERAHKQASKLINTLPLSDQPHPPLIIECDVRSSEDISRLSTLISSHWGKLDFLIHSIAFAQLEDLKKPITECSTTGYLEAMEISAYSLLSTINALKPLFSPQASIVTMSYLGSEVAIPSYGIMGPVKAALESQVRYLAAELGPQGIRVNALSAGPLKTLAASAIPGFRQQLKTSGELTPLRRNITHQEVAQTAVFLCSAMSSGITGETLHVDAGRHAVREL